jgi:hypothetical protein
LFRGIDPSRKYWVTANPAALFQHEDAALAVDGSENIFRLRPGLRLEGTVRLAGSETPAANLRITANLLVNGLAREDYSYRENATSDSEGRFRFTTLCPGTFCLSVDSDAFSRFENVETVEERTFTAGQAEPALIRVKPVEQ